MRNIGQAGKKMTLMPLNAVTFNPSQRAPSRCVIWLHGLGADGHDFENIIPELGLPPDHDVRFVFPHAPYRPITINQNRIMRGWYDIYALGDLTQEDETGIETSCQALEQLIAQQNIPLHRIILAGFSQGGAIALLHAIRHPHLFGGVLGLSTYLPFLFNEKKRPQVTQTSLPILLCHGEFDDLLPVSLAEASYQYLKSRNSHTQFKRYPIAHQLYETEIHDIGSWLIKQLKLIPTKA